MEGAAVQSCRYAASVVATSENQDAGRALISFLASPAGAGGMRAEGF